MFAIRGIDGELFRGSLEHLLRTHRVLRPNAARAVQTGEDEATEQATPSVHQDDPKYHAAAAAYSAAQQPPAQRSPVHFAYQVMTRGVLTIRADANVATAWRELSRRDVGQAPVVDADGRLVGLASRLHLLHALNEDNGSVSHVQARTVGEVMATPVVAVDPVTDVRRIARVMIEYSLPALPVVDSPANSLVGIVSRGDILRVVAVEPPFTLWA